MNTSDRSPFEESIEEINARLTHKYVKVLPEATPDMVVFEFSIGWHDLAVELALPPKQFSEFCATHQVERVPDGPSMVQIELDRIQQQGLLERSYS